MAKSSSPLIAFLLIFYYWFLGFIMFFIPKSLRFKSIKDELVLITGAGSGLGRMLAIRLAKLGAHIVVWDINKTGLEETVRHVREVNPSIKCKPYVCDITDRQSVYETADKVKREMGSVTILVNNAGVVNGQNLMDIPDEKIVQTFNVNAISHFWTIKAFLPDMLANNSGHLVSVASVAGQVGSCQLTDYSASKFACVGFEEALRMELLKSDMTGIKSTIALPYFMNTGMFDGFKSPILPALQPEVVADHIVTGILSNAVFVVIPKSCYILNTLKTILPDRAYNKMYEFLGGFEVMEDFKGRQTMNGKNNNINNNNRKIK